MQRLDRRQHHRDASLVVEMARDDEAAVEEFRLRVYGNDVADLEAEMMQIRRIARPRINTHLDMLPADRQVVHLIVEVWPEAFSGRMVPLYPPSR